MDPDGAHPIPSDWRPTLRAVVSAFVEGDYRLLRVIPRVAPVSEKTAEQARAYVAEYGETLVELPDETWKTSVAQWYQTHWDVLVDLWTKESGRSDMVLHARVRQVETGFEVELHAVYVP